MSTVNIDESPPVEVTIPIKQRDVSFENLESKTFEELENMKITELQDEYFEDEKETVEVQLMDPVIEVIL
jgi:hypothetical protein